MIRIIFTIAVVLGMTGSVSAGEKAHQRSLDVVWKEPKNTLVCFPNSATATVNGVYNEVMSKQILNSSIISNKPSIDLYTDEYKVVQWNDKNTKYKWIGVKNVNGVETVAEMDFVTMTHTITSTADNSVGVLISRCHLPYINKNWHDVN